MKQRCLSWNTNTLSTLCVCVCTAPWVRMTAEPWGGKTASLREEASFHPCSYQKIKPTNTLSWEGGTKKSERCWPAPASAVPRPREDAPISSPRSRRTTQAATAVAAKVLLELAGEIDQICSSTVWLGEIYQVCSITFQCSCWGKWPSQYFKLRDQVHFGQCIKLWYVGKKLTMPQDSDCWFSTFELAMHVTGLKMASENLILD